MTIHAYRSQRPDAANPATPTFLSVEDIRMLAVDIARTVFRHLAPILVDGAQGPGGEIYVKILNDMLARHNNAINLSLYPTVKSSFYRKNVVIRLNDLHYWGKPNADSMWCNEVAA